MPSNHDPAPQRICRNWVLPATVALAALAGCGKSAPPAAGGPGGGGMPPMPATLLAVQPTTVPVAIEAVATLEGVREVEVRARVGGTLVQQLYTEGAPVATGAAMFRIDRAPLQIAVDAARAAVAQAEARAEQARRESGRLATLLAERAISQREADDAASTLKTSQAALLAARAQQRDAELNLGYTMVVAPTAGVAQRAQRSVGALVAPTSDGGLLTTIVQVDPIRVRFALNEAEAAQLRQARAPKVRLLDANGVPLPGAGRLDFTGQVMDRTLGTVPMRAELPNPGGRLLPGQFVRAQIITGEQEAFLVPQAAVQSGDNGRFVWVMGADGKAAPKPVQAGPWAGKDWVIRSGLAAGDKVIVDNLIKMRPGAAVVPAPPPGASGAAPAASAASGAR
ncbi:RND family efflux transporter, MFP subunit [Burkholderiales bacterium JOSHI_001]|nr:RND family efflux transporter, MFP subunit [Burkholderiales bacterium JOSHI_001]